MYETMLVKGNCLATSSTALRRAFLQENGLIFNTDSGYVIVEDFDMWLHIARLGGRFLFIDEVLGVYNVGQDNISLDGSRYWPNLTRLLNDHVFSHQCFEQNREALWRKVRAGLLISEAKLLLQRREPLAALRGLAVAFRTAPGSTWAHCLYRMRQKMGLYR